MTKREVIRKTENMIRQKLAGDVTGHDWYHIDRVRRNAMKIAATEPTADKFIVELAALLHDVADWKFHKGDEKAGSKATRRWLNRLGLDKAAIEKVCEIVDNVSYKGALVKSGMKSLEGKIVQDADKLDAIGAIGIGRTFAFGSYMGVTMYDPNYKPVLHKSFAAYKKNNTSTINHFYEKLLLLKDRMHTKAAKKMTQRRHRFMEAFLKEFYREWNGKE